MRLIKDSIFLKKYFAESSRPTKRQLKKWVYQGVVKGWSDGSELWIDEDNWHDMQDPKNTTLAASLVRQGL